MKLHINQEDLNQLNEKRKERLRKWWKPQEGDRIFFDRWDCDGIVRWIDDKKMKVDCSGSPMDDIWNLPQNTESAIMDWGINEPIPLLSIGQMIEFLIDHNSNYGPIDDLTSDICDLLWPAVKEILEKE